MVELAEQHIGKTRVNLFVQTVAITGHSPSGQPLNLTSIPSQITLAEEVAKLRFIGIC